MNKSIVFTRTSSYYHPVLTQRLQGNIAFRYFGGYPDEILYDNMKQVVVKRLLKQADSELNRQFEDFTGFYGYKPVLCRPYCRQTKGKVERTVAYVRDNFMTGIKYNSLDD